MSVNDQIKQVDRQCPLGPVLGPVIVVLWSKLECNYRLGSEGDNRIGCICPSVCLCALSWLNCLTYDLDIWHGGGP